MVFDLEAYKSHPDKSLLCHTQGVLDNVKRLTNSEMAELAAIFHDFGKMNDNFQQKLKSASARGYANHAFLSAYAFFCLACRKKSLAPNSVFAICMMIAKHHGNLPDFVATESHDVLSKTELHKLWSYLQGAALPFYEFASAFVPGCPDFSQLVHLGKAQDAFGGKMLFSPKDNNRPLEFFMDTQFSFASLVQSDKIDAACFYDYRKDDEQRLADFCSSYSSCLHGYMQKLGQDSELNKVRTAMRKQAVEALSAKLPEGGRVFELTSPTGSGKTLMLLSLAGEILKAKGPMRIIYSIPFLSITEQVECEVLKIFSDGSGYIQRIDSKSSNSRIDEIQNLLDSNPSEDLYQELNMHEFQDRTFDYPFVITTFVRFFETLMSNRNSELLKLPNFANCIFLLDEIQALPPRLYSFFVGYLDKFCRKFNSYTIISTATQPYFDFVEKSEAQEFFGDYQKPVPLLPLSYFSNDVFNRYNVSFINSGITVDELCAEVSALESSVLVILNTIDDTRRLYELLRGCMPSDSLILLNTHFTPNDRKRKIALAKQRLASGDKVVMVSTQLIEAGVDIDFPILFRDFTTVSSIVQSAGRCNRNGRMPKKGDVRLFFLKGDNGKNRVDCIFKGRDKELIQFTKESLEQGQYQEKDLINVQNAFFKAIQSQLVVADYGFSMHKDNLISEIKKCAFDKIGRFSLIDKREFGQIERYYVPQDADDDKFELLFDYQDELLNMMRSSQTDKVLNAKKRQIANHLQKITNQVVEVRIRPGQTIPIMADSRDYFGLKKIDLEFYTFEEGVNLNNQVFIL